MYLTREELEIIYNNNKKDFAASKSTVETFEMSQEHTIASIATIIIFLLLVVYVIGGSFSEKKKFVVGHETGLAILIGFLISLIIMVSGKKEINKSFMFDDKVFFYFCLPPIIFSSGYNMQRKKFFSNFGYILIFGLIGTIITFVVFTIITYAFMEAGVMWKYNVNSE